MATIISGKHIRHHFQVNEANLDTICQLIKNSPDHFTQDFVENFMDTKDRDLFKKNMSLCMRAQTNPSFSGEWMLKITEGDDSVVKGVRFKVIRGKENVLDTLKKLWTEWKMELPLIDEGLEPNHFAQYLLASFDTKRYYLSKNLWMDVSLWGIGGTLGVYGVLTFATKENEAFNKSDLVTMFSDKANSFKPAASKLFAFLHQIKPTLLDDQVDKLVSYNVIDKEEDNIFGNLRPFPKWPWHEDVDNDDDDDDDDEDDIE
jgi:hypothetical protein